MYNWGLSVNLGKSKIVVFRKGGNLSKLDCFTFQGNSIEIVKEYKYLGVSFYWNGNFKNHFKERAASARIGIYSIWRFINGNSPIIAKFKVFDAIYKAILIYAAQSWGNIRSDALESVQRFFIRKLFNLPFNTPNYILLLECGRYSIFLSAFKLHLRYLLKISQMNNNRYPYICYKDGIDNNVGWFVELNKLSNEAGLSINLKTSHSLIEKAKYFEKLLLILHEQEKQSLFSSVNKSQFHLLYKTLKTDFLMENYMLDNNLPHEYVQLIFGARCESLSVKYKPWLKNNASEYKCIFCNSGESDTILHVISNCDRFTLARKKYFNSAYISVAENVLVMQKVY